MGGGNGAHGLETKLQEPPANRPEAPFRAFQGTSVGGPANALTGGSARFHVGFAVLLRSCAASGEAPGTVQGRIPHRFCGGGRSKAAVWDFFDFPIIFSAGMPR